MSFVEVILFISSLLILVVVLFRKNNGVKRLWVFIPVVLVLLVTHFVFDLVRWQLYPLYVGIILLFVFIIVENYKDVFIPKWIRRISMTIISIMYVFSLFSVYAFPIYEIPTPSGEYSIGTQKFVIEDTNRLELYSDEEYRRFMVQVWYPAETVDGYEQAPWLEGGLPLSKALARDNYLPSFALNHSVHVVSNSFFNAPISEVEDNYPVVVVSHGWRGFRTLHTDFIEELASHGYVVVSIDHTYGSVATVFSENDVSYLNLDALPSRENNDDFLVDANLLVNTYSGDIVDTLNWIEEINLDNSSDFYNKLDTSNIGLIGHSTGGGASVQTVLNDNRVSSVLGLDAWVEPIGISDLETGLTIPSLFLRSETWETGENNEYLYTLIEESTTPSNLYQIDGTTHYDFAMVYMYSPLTKYIGFTGSVESDKLVLLLKSTIVDFFDETLNGKDSTLNLDEIDEFQKVDTTE